MLPVLVVSTALLVAASPSGLSRAPHTQKAATGVVSLCSIRSNRGNCYTAGEFCREDDLGKTTTDAAGDNIACVMESGRPHWHYSDTGDDSSSI